MAVVDLSVVSFVVPAILTGLASWIAAKHTSRSNERIATEKRADDARQEAAAAKASEVNDITRRFKMLMDGYEARIRDLTTEVAQLRVEVAELRAELTDRDRRNHDGTD